MKTRAKTRAAARSSAAVGVLRLGHAQVVGDAEREVAARVGVVEGAVHRDVGLEQAMVSHQRPPRIALRRRPRAEQVGVRGEHVGLVDRDPFAAQVAQRAHRLDREARHPPGELLGEESAATGHPLREREVVEGDHRAQPRVYVRAHDLAVVIERRGVERSGPRLDASPFDREPGRVQPHRSLKSDVLAKAVPRVAGEVDRVAVLDAPVPGEGVPVDRRAVPFDLSGAGGGAEAKCLGEDVHAPRRIAQREGACATSSRSPVANLPRADGVRYFARAFASSSFSNSSSAGLFGS